MLLPSFADRSKLPITKLFSKTKIVIKYLHPLKKSAKRTENMASKKLQYSEAAPKYLDNTIKYERITEIL